MAFTPVEIVTLFDAERKCAEAASAHVEAALLHAATAGDLSEKSPAVDTEQDLLCKAAEATEDAALLGEALVHGTKQLAAQTDFIQ